VSEVDDLVAVRVRDCPDGSHGAGDYAYLKPEADIDIGFAVHGVVGRATGDANQMTVELGHVYLRYGIARWDMHDPGGKTWPIDLASIKRIPWTLLYPVADKAAELYGSVLDPLVARLLTASRNGSTDASTSATRRSSGKRQKH
jgi:hypothetical protein